MTVAQSPRYSGPYTMTGGQTVVDYDFPIDNASDMIVKRTRGTSETTLELDVDYGVTGVGAANGTIILTPGATAGDIIEIFGRLPIERVANFPGFRSIPNNAINDELDRMTKALQEMRRDVDASIHTAQAGAAYDVQNRRIVNVADGIDPSDAATIGQIKPFADAAQAAKDAAEAARDVANAASAAAAEDAAEAAAAAAAAEAALVGAQVPFPTIAALLASTDPARGTGWRWRAGLFEYEEAASDATDHDVTTAGGVKLYALSRQGPTYQTVAELSGQMQPGPTKALRTLFFDSNAVAGSGVDLSDAGTVNPNAPGQVSVDVAGVTHFYTLSNKVLRPQQFGVRNGGNAANNRSGLIEMFSAASLTGFEIDMGDANDNYEIDDSIVFTWAKRPLIRGSGAKIKLNRNGGAAVATTLYFASQYGFDIEGITIDANFDAPRAFELVNPRSGTYDEALDKDVRCVGVEAGNVYCRTSIEPGTRCINIMGWARRAVIADCVMGEAKIASGAYNVNYSTVGLFVGRDTSSRYPLHKDIRNIVTKKVWSEDPSQSSNMDAIMIYDALPANGLTIPAGSTTMRGGMLRDFWGRGVKVQALNVDISDLHGELRSGPESNQVIAFVDFQFGSGSLRGGSLQAYGVSPKNIVIGQTQPYSTGQTFVTGLKYTGSYGTPEPDSFAWRYAEASGRTDGGLVVRDCLTRIISVKTIARWSTRAGAVAERVSVTGNSMMISGSAVAFEFFGAEPAAATIRDNINLTTSNKPLYTRKDTGGSAVTNTVTINGTTSDNLYFSAGT